MKLNRFLIFLVWGILLQSPLLYDILGQSISDHDIIISGYNPNNNSFRFLALNDIPANTQIFFTDDLSLLDPLDQFNSNIQTYDYGKLEGLLIFESDQKIEFGTEIIWIGGVENELFREFGTFYLSMIKDQIIIFQHDLSESLISGISYGPVEDQTRKIITSNKGLILTLFNGIGQCNLIYPEIVSKNDLLKYYSNENNWGEYKDTRQNRPKKNILNKNSMLDDAEKLKLMPLGDSITRGKNKLSDPDFVGFRRPLFRKLDSAGYNVQTECFLGSIVTDTIFTDFDTDHEGHGGYQAYTDYTNGIFWKDLYHNLDGSFSGSGGENWLGLNSPDYILLHIGSNDIGQNESAESVVDQIEDVVDKIFSVNSNVILFLAKIINIDTTAGSNLGPNFEETSSLNVLLESFAANHPNSQNIYLIDMESKLDYSTELVDDVHPNDIGYDKMAEEWFNSIQTYFQPQLVSPSDKSIIPASNVLFDWFSEGSNSKSFHLQVALDNSFSQVILDINDLSLTSFETNALNSGTKYFWRIRAQNYGGYSDWSQVFEFATNSFQLSIKVFLEGAYIGSESLSSQLSEKDLLPNLQPYNSIPWNYEGNEELNDQQTDLVDWLLLSLSVTQNYGDISYKKALPLNNMGEIVDFDGDTTININGIPPGDYYVFLEHRNHLPILSSNKVQLK